MRRNLKLALLPLGIFVISAALIPVPNLRVSMPAMKSRAALHLNFGDSRAQVNTFLRSQHMGTEATSSPTVGANGTRGEKWIVKVRPLLAPPIYFRFDFTRDKLDSWAVAEARSDIDFDVSGGAVAL